MTFHQRHWLQSGDCTKSPTWSTISLIFNLRYHSFGCPINICSEFVKCCINIFPFWIIRFRVKVNWLELLIGQNCKFIDSHIVSSWRISIVFFDNFQIFLENNFPIHILNLIVFNSMDCLPWLKFRSSVFYAKIWGTN